jgi:hypothetical protein
MPPPLQLYQQSWLDKSLEDQEEARNSKRKREQERKERERQSKSLTSTVTALKRSHTPLEKDPPHHLQTPYDGFISARESELMVKVAALESQVKE